MNFFRGFGLPELLIILAVVLLLFGATRLPKLAQSMGQAIREFRKGASPESEAPSKPKGRATPKQRGKDSEG